MAYRLILRPAAQRDLRRLQGIILGRVEGAVTRLRENPHPPGCRKLSGFENEWRVRVGDYRILYIVDDVQQEIRVARIAHRREAYR